LPHARRINPGGELSPDAGRVEAQVTRVLDQVVVVQRELTLEQTVVHLPELPLGARRFGRLRRVLGVWVALPQREVAKHEAQAPAQASLDLLDDRIRTPAVRTLVVAVLHQRDGCVRPAPNVVSLAHGERERRRRGALAHAGALAPASASRA